MRICKICHSEFFISQDDLAFYEKLAKTTGFDPALFKPANCLPCRERARFVFRNERYYYQTECTLCCKSIISVYNPKFHKKIYCHNCWWSDKWDAKEYGKDFDFGRSFFDQYKELLKDVPKLAMMNDNVDGTPGSLSSSENCEYTYDFSRGKNCYLVIGSWYVRDCMYGFQINYVRDCIDNYFVNESELMYNCLFCEKCYNCQECMQCDSSRDVIFGYDLKNCKNCILCVGLRNKNYCIRNKQYSEQDFYTEKAKLGLDTWDGREELRKEFAEFILKFPHKYSNFVNCENCSGNNLITSKNAHECFNFRNLHDCKWMTNGDCGKDSYECYSVGNPELCYQCIAPDNGYGVMFSVYCWTCKFVAYSENCHSSYGLFGCVGLKRGRFCILNKEYKEEEYKTNVTRIAKQMRENGEFGEFFKSDLCSFAYNETSAMEWYPLDEDEALKLGYRWENNLPGTYGKETVKWGDVPERSSEIDAGIGATGRDFSKEIFPCVQCGKSYKIQQKEFEFYKKGGIPLPRFCIDCRYKRRKNLMNPRRLWARQCECGEKFLTTFAPGRPEQVYCEKCYEKIVY